MVKSWVYGLYWEFRSENSKALYCKGEANDVPVKGADFAHVPLDEWSRMGIYFRLGSVVYIIEI